jgi:hypothetical protein
MSTQFHPPFGNQTVIFVSAAVDTPGAAVGSLGEQISGPAGSLQTPTKVAVQNCRHRPLRDSETPQYLTDVATQVWKTTAPPVPAAMAADPTGHLIVNGITYKIVAGAQPFPDPQSETGAIFKVTILSYVHVG